MGGMAHHRAQRSLVTLLAALALALMASPGGAAPVPGSEVEVRRDLA